MNKVNKPLLVFAHWGEAEAFLLDFKPKKISPDLFSHELFDLLLTGEGHFAVIKKVTEYLSSHQPTRIINFGLAGSLNSHIKTDQIYQVRTTYSFFGEMDFKSFSSEKTQNPFPVVDCVSCYQRVKNAEQRHYLNAFASIVDREVWAIGYVAHEFKLPFQSYKIISDEAQEGTRCELIQEKARFYSEKLLEVFLSLGPPAPASSIDVSTFLPYATETQKNKFTHQLEYLSRIKKISLQECWHELQQLPSIQSILQSTDKPKVKTQKILDYLEEERYPELSKFKQKLTHILNEYKNPNWSIQYPDKEEAMAHLQLKIKDRHDLKRLTQEIEAFPFEKINALYEGHF